MPRLPLRTIAAALTALVAWTMLLVAAPSPARAGTYWWSGAPSPGSNGFSWGSADQPYWNPWSTARCETRGATIPAGNPCTLSWHVPAGLDALGGSISGTYRHANAAFEQRNVVECNGTTVLQGTSTAAAFTRQWPDMCGYLNVSLLTPTAATTVSAASQYFEATAFSIQLVDPTTPQLAAIEGHGGWHGASGACVRYAFTESGSGLVGASLTNATTGQTLDAAAWSSAPIVTGAGAVDRRPCFAAPAQGTGTYVLRAIADDRSGNRAQHDVPIAFDLTAPRIETAKVGGFDATGGDVRLHGSDGGYRPQLAIAASDADSGVASVQLRLDGEVVASTATWQAPRDLAPGVHRATFRAVDAVGNVASATYEFQVVDDVPPSIAIELPGGSGGNEPVLDARASDDASGVDAASWTVRVNGVQLAVSGGDASRLQVNLGYLVDGVHELEIRVRDAAGNERTVSASYAADSGDDVPDPTQSNCPGMTCVLVHEAPNASTTVHEGATARIKALFVKRGRPVPGRAEIRKGDDTLAGKDIEASGKVDLALTVDRPGPVTLVPPTGSGLDPVQIEYRFVAKPAPTCETDPSLCHTDIGNCRLNPLAPGCSIAGGGSPMLEGAGVNLPNPAASSSYPRNVVYYINGVPYWNGIPLAESGAPLDAVPPTWRLTIRQQPAGAVRRKRMVYLRLWTSELSVVNLLPVDAKGRPVAVQRTTASARRSPRTIAIAVGPRTKLGRQLAAARPGARIRIRVRVIATDKRGNRARARTLSFRVQV